MIEERCFYKSTAVKSKLFVVGGSDTNNFVVLDSTTNKFTRLMRSQSAKYLPNPVEVITVGTKLYVFRNNGKEIVSDIDND